MGFRLVGAVLDAGVMVTASAGGVAGWGQVRWWGRLRPQLDILRLTTRGNARSLRTGKRRWRISARVRSQAAVRRSGGKSRLGRDLAANNTQRAGEGEPVGIGPGIHSGLVHDLADGVVDEEEAVDLLLDTVGMPGSQDHVRAALVNLDLVQHPFHLSGRCGALLRRTPLRTGRAALTASGSSRP